jgi:hypothetical protein
MTFRLIIILLMFSSVVLGQKPTDEDILEIISASIEQKKLPHELINNVDSLWAVGTRQPYNRKERAHYPLTVGVEATKENGLTYHKRIKWDEKEIWVWGGEDFFTHDIYWITPSNIKMKDTKVSFNFATHTWGDKAVNYYKGTIMAEKIGKDWRITKSKLRKTKNDFDPWKQRVDRNPR